MIVLHCSFPILVFISILGGGVCNDFVFNSDSAKNVFYFIIYCYVIFVMLVFIPVFDL